ncbi:DUF5131 family protein, partial [Patescibacteria group bacterium]|nr:DUF5131 family protein [Patescibacteria group bacterium]
MADKTKIQYVDATFSPWSTITPGPNGTRMKTAESTWRLPERWNRKAAKTGEPFRVMNSMCDVFEDFDGDVIDKHGRQLVFDSQIGIRSLPIGIRLGIDVLPVSTQKALTIDHLRLDFFRLVRATPNLTWLMFTKRPKNVRRMIPPIDGGCGGDCCKYRGNCWLIYSASDQATLDAGLPHLLACRDLVSILGLSLEPLLGPIDLSQWIGYTGGKGGENERRYCLHCGHQWRLTDRPKGADLAHSYTPRRPMDSQSEEDQLLSSPGGTPNTDRISPDSDD